jgi:hypothetical protein
MAFLEIESQPRSSLNLAYIDSFQLLDRDNNLGLE